jgi:hypothetical protein
MAPISESGAPRRAIGLAPLSNHCTNVELLLSLDDAGFSEVRWCLLSASVRGCPTGTLRWPIGNSNRPHPLAQLQGQVSPLAGIEPYIAGAG